MGRDAQPGQGEGSPLRWMGSKRTIAPTVYERLGQVRGRYLEPFCGSAGVFFHAKPARAVLGDTNPHLIQFLEALRDDPVNLHRLFAEIPTDPNTYHKIRSQSPGGLEPLPRAARFLYLNRLCFNGLYRTNRAGEFNVPIGARQGQMPGLAWLLRSAEALSSATLLCADFQTTLSDASRGDVAYLDPPYTSTRRDSHGEYGYGTFGDSDWGRLLGTLDHLTEQGVRWVLSYRYCRHAASELTRRYTVELVGVRRRVAASAARRCSDREMLVHNRCLV